MPTDERIAQLSPAQELWLAARVYKSRRRDEKRLFEFSKLLCSFINPEMAKHMFDDAEPVENTGFYEDLKSFGMDIDIEQIKDMLGE